MAQMAVPNHRTLKVTAMFFDPNRDSAPIGRAALQTAGLINTHFHLDKDIAIAFQDATPMELIIVDLSPDTKADGLALIRAARRRKTATPPRILGLLAGGTREALMEAIKGGVDTVIAKPLIPDNLFKKIKQLLAAPQNYIEVKGYYGPDRRRIPSPDEFSGDDRRG